MNDSEKFTKLIGSMTKRLDVVSKAIDKLVSQIDAENVSNWGKIKSQISLEYEKARRIINEWVQSAIPDTYKDAFRETIADIKNKVVHVPRVSLDKLATQDKHLREVINNTLGSFADGLDSGETNLLRLLNLTQQTVREEARVNKDVAQGFEEKGNAQSAKRRLQQDLMSKAKEGKYIEIVDRNGDTRNYQISDYAEMVARTKLSDASFQSVVNAASQVQADLVQISSHNTQTPLCAEYEGKIFSLSGNDPDFPTLDAEPPFHPNCLHSASIVFKEALQADGTLDGYIAFSNGDSTEPPLTKGFVPISERNMQ